MTDDFRGMQQRQNPLEHFFQGTQARTNPFGSNRSAERAYERAERVVAALYLITNHIDSSEPERIAIRSAGLSLFEAILSMRDDMRSASSTSIPAFNASIRSLISLVRMLAVSGAVSTQNASMLIDALDELGTYVSASQRTPLSENISLSKSDFEVPVRSIGRSPLADSIKDIKDRSSIKDSFSNKDRRDASDGRGPGPRAQDILGVLRTSGPDMGIRDIAAHVPQYSEKMIQRELVALVAVGKVRKTGLKRWSRYSAS